MASVEEGMQSAIRNLEEKTGKSMADWAAIVKGSGFAKHGQVVSYLKSEHGLTHGYANMVALRSLAADDAPEGDDLIAAQYDGAKGSLKPVYDELIARISMFGSDVEISPKKSYVSLRRSKQFAILQPTTATRLDVGINLKGIEPAGRLEASGSFNAMLSHRVRVNSAAEIDDELVGWLKQAYDAA